VPSATDALIGDVQRDHGVSQHDGGRARGFSNGYYCNPALDREMQQAQLLELTDPTQAAVVWASVDRQITDAAVWVPTVTLRDVEVTSRRLGNYQHNPVWGFLADQAWLR
jgi:ABC-type transport system substrate-binding protein